MKFYKEEQDTYIRKILVREECDKCGKDIIKNLYPYEINDFIMEWKEGFDYPEGGGFQGVKTTIDLCLPCKNELLKLLVDNGYTPQVKEYD